MSANAIVLAVLLPSLVANDGQLKQHVKVSNPAVMKKPAIESPVLFYAETAKKIKYLPAPS